jgi:hypothetical protein
VIFDSPEMIELLKIYDNQPNFLVPQIVALARLPLLDGERIYLEGIVATVNANKQIDWLKRLINKDHAQHMGAWFEMMLVGWCRDVGKIEIEPDILGDCPDLSIAVGEQKIILEARAIIKTKEERDEEILNFGIVWALTRIKKPFVVQIDSVTSTQFPDWDDITQKTEEWLETNPDEIFHFDDGNTSFDMQTIKVSQTIYKTVQVMGPSGAKWVNPEPIKNPLREKAGQHKAVRSAAYPYLVSLYLESNYFFPEEVVETWFGKETYVIDVDERKAVGSYIDKSGIHYLGPRIRHTTVSGTLVFKSTWSKEDKRQYLDAWYIQNPYAKVYVDPKIFPVHASFVVQEHSSRGYRMGWERH